LPLGWSSPLLSEVAHRESGHTPDIGVPEYWNGDIRWLSLADCDRLNNVFVSETTKSITKLGIENSSARLLPAGVVVLSRDAGVGQSAITACPIAVSQHFLAWECSEVLSSKFLYYWFQRLRPELERIAVGSTIKTIGLGYFDKLRVPLPPKQLQLGVSNALYALDVLSNEIKALSDAKGDYKRGLMQQLLTGQKRFPEFLSEKWGEVHLGSIFLERNEANRPDLPLLSVTGDRGLIPRDEVDKRDTSNPDKSKYKRVAIGDIAYNTMRMWQGVSALASMEGIISPAYTVAIPTDRISGRFAKHLFKYPPVINLFHRHSQGLVDDTLNLKFDRFAKIKLTIPRDVDEQERIAGVFDLVDREIALLAAQRAQVELYKRGLLSRLLSGELKVPA